MAPGQLKAQTIRFLSGPVVSELCQGPKVSSCALTDEECHDTRSGSTKSTKNVRHARLLLTTMKEIREAYLQTLCERHPAILLPQEEKRRYLDLQMGDDRGGSERSFFAH